MRLKEQNVVNAELLHRDAVKSLVEVPGDVGDVVRTAELLIPFIVLAITVSPHVYLKVCLYASLPAVKEKR